MPNFPDKGIRRVENQSPPKRVANRLSIEEWHQRTCGPGIQDDCSRSAGGLVGHGDVEAILSRRGKEVNAHAISGMHDQRIVAAGAIGQHCVERGSLLEFSLSHSGKPEHRRASRKGVWRKTDAEGAIGKALLYD